MEEGQEVLEQGAQEGQDAELNQGEQPQDQSTDDRDGALLFDDPDDDQAPPAAGENGEQPEVDAAAEAGTTTFREMRKNFKGALKDKRRLEIENEQLRARLPKEETPLGQKPTLDQFDYDEDRFSKAYDDWMERKVAFDRREQEKASAQAREQQEVENFRKSYQARSQALRVDDFQEVEQEVGAMLSQTQVGLLMRGADDPAVLVYALGKSPERLIELSKIADPVKFTAAVAKMEVALSTKRTKPAPEPRINAERSGGASTVGGASQLERLREEAARTGDFTKVTQYKRQHNIT